MEFKFDRNTPHQLNAIAAVVDVFKGQPLAGNPFEGAMVSRSMDVAQYGSLNFTEKGIGNRLVLTEEQILKNIQTVQAANGLQESTALVPRLNSDERGPDGEADTRGETPPASQSSIDSGTPQNRLNVPTIDLNLSIEMETGTGKTYTYIRTMYELNKQYGFCKFVIVVPSVAIREGTLTNLRMTAKDMQAQYGTPADYKVWDSTNRNGLRNFAASNTMQILVINIDSFTGEHNVINAPQESGVKPIEFLQATCPIVIVDEPQNMETPTRRRAIANLSPLCTLRYSATHKNPYNLLSRLTPMDAYNQGLVKQIQVDGITAEENYNAAYVSFKAIQRAGKSTLKAKLGVFVNGANGVLQKDLSLKVGEDLFDKTNGREIYRNGFILESMDFQEGHITFSSGLTMQVGQEQGGLNEDMQRYQIERTVKWHFERTKKLKPIGVKVLSLFFIDKVVNYRESAEGENTGKFAKWFEAAFNKYSRQNVGLIPYPAEAVHRGYFSQDRTGRLKDTRGTTKDDESTYELIMKKKESLLSLDEPVQFIFSHSALREGWDNPNVFQICTLNESHSELKKRQEIGRGLRLPVNQEGERIFDPKINLLTVVANESYETFSKALQTEIEEETGVPFKGIIRDANREKAQIKLIKTAVTRENYPMLFEIWDKVRYKTTYKVMYDEQELIDKSVASLEDLNHYPKVTHPRLHAATARISLHNEGVQTMLTDNAMDYSTKEVRYPIPDVFGFIQSRVEVSRTAVVQVLKNSQRMNELLINPQKFLEYVVSVIKAARNEILTNGGVKYERGAIHSDEYTQKLFTDELGEIFEDLVLEVNEDKQDKTIYTHYKTDSGIERDFAQDCERHEEVKFFFKIPKGFKIPTPLGNYTPDWAVVLEEDNRLYFVAETKGTLDKSQLSTSEAGRIKLGSEMINSLETGVRYKLAVKAVDLIGSH